MKTNNLINTLKTLNKNDKITIAGFNNIGFVQVLHTKFQGLDIKENNFQKFVCLIHKPKGKRKYFQESLSNKDIVILKDWVDIDTEQQYNTQFNNDTITKESIYTAFDSTFLKDIALIWEKELIYSNVNEAG